MAPDEVFRIEQKLETVITNLGDLRVLVAERFASGEVQIGQNRKDIDSVATQNRKEHGEMDIKINTQSEKCDSKSTKIGAMIIGGFTILGVLMVILKLA